jgi:DnaK suppressor protein
MTKAQKASRTAAKAPTNETKAAKATPKPVKATSSSKPPTRSSSSSSSSSKARSAKLSPFLAAQRDLLVAERETYVRSANELKAQADSLALEHEPGDVQFDEEGGEGGTSNVDRELDLVLSAQANAAVNEIDWALEKIVAGTYGLCERCGEQIPEARLEALPHATLCVACKSGGLSSRR